MKLVCEWCFTEFPRPNKVGPIPKFCKRSHKQRAYEMRKMATYDREKLINVLVYHQHTNTSGCICGWAVLGASHPEHVANVYEMELRSQ